MNDENHEENGDSGNPNEVVLLWKRSSENFYDTLVDDAHIYTYGMELTKLFSDGRGDFSKVEFIIHNDTDNYFVKAELNEAERNVLFTAITRSRAWVRICGVGSQFDILMEEFQKCYDNGFQLSFKCPTEKEMNTIRNLNRERTQEEKEKAAKAKSNIDQLIALLEQGGIDKDIVPELDTLINVLNKKKAGNE